MDACMSLLGGGFDEGCASVCVMCGTLIMENIHTCLRVMGGVCVCVCCVCFLWG